MLDYLALFLVFVSVYGIFLFALKNGWLPGSTCR